MKMQYVINEEELERVISKIMDKRLPPQVADQVEKTYTINQVARLLGRSHKKISDLVASGILATTPDRRIYESSIREYNKK
ncbi:hypothetical protein M2459_002166 [Parabacteroides sp. PF5-5]|nr:hypothetical protein [Parabacteroides sp. PH5-39]MDH6316263.1 hypothetical protein [Parabacteroides sp. PF5-13]MDH6319746.1 hypothetical protein [Parabacteroides sp. PH5-13]MDH6323662.1 hypothetical protein [Parabacteroides sp. PH5-8]MDH6327450.1 hypothetical protein [Parabacteroides sp. PH5-41]MDH6335410.1 hypothetical protein [Parabacteroides sp. PF5-5]MDH6346473.1 hypothetical protein [Parabacteroides sp. PH5-46]MDH6361276.1 hypothetical protein [Parabacteroides sp. PH5-16]MDH6376943.